MEQSSEYLLEFNANLLVIAITDGSNPSVCSSIPLYPRISPIFLQVE
jgi:hypothetical protein